MTIHPWFVPSGRRRTILDVVLMSRLLRLRPSLKEHMKLTLQAPERSRKWSRDINLLILAPKSSSHPLKTMLLSLTSHNRSGPPKTMYISLKARISRPQAPSLWMIDALSLHLCPSPLILITHIVLRQKSRVTLRVFFRQVHLR